MNLIHILSNASFIRIGRYIAVILVVLFEVNVLGQTTVTVVTGNTTSVSCTDAPCPLPRYYRYNRQQILLRTNELTAAGISSNATLSNIKFNITNVCGTGNIIYTIKMKCVTATSLTTSFDNSSLTTVYTGTINPTATGLFTITFSTAFSYTAGQSLLIDICTDSGGTLSSSSQRNCKYKNNSGYNSWIYAQSDGSSQCGVATSPYSATQWLPELQLAYTVPCTAPSITAQPSTSSQTTCQNGTAFSSLSVTATGTSPTYQWQQSTDGSTGWVSAVGGTGASTGSYTPPNSSAGTLYYRCYISNTCGNATSNVTGVFTVNSVNSTSVSSLTGTLTSGDFLWSGTTSANWNVSSNWYSHNGTTLVTAAVVPAVTNRVFILVSSTVPGCISSVNTATVNAAGYAKDLLIGGGATLIISANQTLEVQGNWTNNGIFDPNSSGTVSFKGTAAQTINGSSANNFTNVLIDKSSNTLTLNTAVNVSGTLTMTRGNIATSATFLLTVGTSALSPGSITWTSGTVVGPLRRYFSGTANATPGSGIFPVGLSAFNRYAQVNYTSGLTTGGTITAEYKAGVCPVGYAGLPTVVNNQMIQNYENNGYWIITPSGGNLNVATYSLILRGNGLSTVTSVVTMSKLRIIKSVSHTTWDNIGIGLHTTPLSGGTTDFTITNTGMTGFSWFNIGSNNSNALPVILTGLSVRCTQNNVDLHWSTASEQNSQKFIVEKSRDLSQWIFVSELEASGNSAMEVNYNTTDIDPYGGISYYRLMQIDNDGTEKIYMPISVSCSGQDNSMIVFPNPTKGSFTVEIASTENLHDAEVQLMDLTGKLIASRKMDIVEGKNHILFEESNLQMGTYIVQLVSAIGFKPVKVVVN